MINIFDILNFFIGIVLLYYCSELLINNGSLLAKKYNISKMIIGMSLVALGTSLPEFIVSIIASLQDKVDLVIGNVIGSNIANIGLVLGLSGISYHISCNFKNIRLDILFLILSTVSFSGILYFNQFGNLYAIFLMLILIIYIYIIFKFNKFDNDVGDSDNISTSLVRLITFIFAGGFGLSLGSYLLIDSSIVIAKYFKISEMIIGATAVALGTSLPELAASITAAKKKEFELVLGNIFGSNIINILLVFSTSLLINNTMPKTENFNYGLVALLSLTLLLIISLATGKIHRLLSLLFLCIYTYYIFLIL